MFSPAHDVFTDTVDAGEELLRLDINLGKHCIRYCRGDIFVKMRDLLRREQGKNNSDDNQHGGPIDQRPLATGVAASAVLSKGSLLSGAGKEGPSCRAGVPRVH